MPRRLAATTSLIVFAFCLLLGIRADNTFSTTLTRALVALAGTFIIGLIVGVIAQHVVEENVQTEKERLEKAAQPAPDEAS